MPDRLFRDRRDAGRCLAGLLDHYRGRPGVVVLGLARGGVPVGYEIAAALGAALDVSVVRRLGVPGREEPAAGAIATGGVLVLNEDVVRHFGISPGTIQSLAEREGRELLRREEGYREGRPALDCRGQVAIIADEVACATTPSPFFAASAAYWDFRPVTGEEARDLLRAVNAPRPERAAAGAPPQTARGPARAGVLRARSVPARDGVPADEALFDLVGDAQLVLLGEASHGTQEFYDARARITRRLIEERGFGAVAVEADCGPARTG